MFWAAINFTGLTVLVFIENGTLYAHRYIKEVLISHAQPALTSLGHSRNMEKIPFLLTTMLAPRQYRGTGLSIIE